MRRTNHAYDFATDPTPSQRRCDAPSRGERRLMLAVLEDALRTVLNARRVGRTREAWARLDLGWFLSDDRSHPFAFEVICDVLDLDATWLRRRLRTDLQRSRGAARARRLQSHVTLV